MAKPTQTRSAALPLKLTAFGGLFTALCVAFDPTLAYAFALVAVVLLAKV
jgi:hypothetical protein